MNKIKITVKKITIHNDLIKDYENYLDNPCNMKEGMTFIVEDQQQPNDFCDSAWDTIYPFVKVLSNGGGNFFNGWMKNEKSAMISCNDGFRPVSFFIEVID